jgi:hypothetical protein
MCDTTDAARSCESAVVRRFGAASIDDARNPEHAVPIQATAPDRRDMAIAVATARERTTVDVVHFADDEPPFAAGKPRFTKPV